VLIIILEVVSFSDNPELMATIISVFVTIPQIVPASSTMITDPIPFSIINLETSMSHSEKKWPNKALPEIAFMGVSNAGKSTLINALLNAKNLVRTSKKPGHTKALNLFQVGNRFALVDMPGYGHRSRVEWGELVEKYLTEGVSENGRLKRVYLLIESKRNFKHLDQMIIELLERLKVPYQILITKADKLNPKLWDENYLNPQTAPLASFIRQHAYHIADSSLLFLSPVQARFGIAQLRCQILDTAKLIPSRLSFFASEQMSLSGLPSMSELRTPSKAARREYAASLQNKYTEK